MITIKDGAHLNEKRCFISLDRSEKFFFFHFVFMLFSDSAYKKRGTLIMHLKLNKKKN